MYLYTKPETELVIEKEIDMSNKALFTKRRANRYSGKRVSLSCFNQCRPVTVYENSETTRLPAFPIYIHDSYTGMGVQLEL